MRSNTTKFDWYYLQVFISIINFVVNYPKLLPLKGIDPGFHGTKWQQATNKQEESSAKCYGKRESTERANLLNTSPWMKMKNNY